MFSKVIVGFDGSERALDALSLAEALTASDGQLIVCCVHRYPGPWAAIDPTEPGIDLQTARRYVADATRQLSRELTVTPLCLAGAGVAATLRRIVIAEDVDLLVLGSSRRGAVGRVLIGSVTEEILHRAPCPVAIAPVGFHGHPAGARLAHVAVGHDTVQTTPEALAAGVALCTQTGAGLSLVAVAEDAAVANSARAEMSYDVIVEARLRAAERAVADARAQVPANVSVTSDIRDGDPAEQLLQVTDDADLLILGSHLRGPLGRAIMGSVCDRVVRAAACPVLVVPPGAAQTPRAAGDADR